MTNMKLKCGTAEVPNSRSEKNLKFHGAWRHQPTTAPPPDHSSILKFKPHLIRSGNALRFIQAMPHVLTLVWKKKTDSTVNQLFFPSFPCSRLDSFYQYFMVDLPKHMIWNLRRWHPTIRTNKRCRKSLALACLLTPLINLHIKFYTTSWGFSLWCDSRLFFWLC